RRLFRRIQSASSAWERSTPKTQHDAWPGSSCRTSTFTSGNGRRRGNPARRVTPALVPVFAMVLADRAAGTVNAPAAPGARPIPASDSAADVGRVRASAAPNPAIDDEPATDPSIF